MYLKRLDLQGFKSFPTKVKMEFNKGITAIVGPNGSGKSNISDAVRWVLGEQKVRTLRGDKMEDVIFAGTEHRKPLGFAEVSITIDNSEHIMPIDYTEVTVTRRVFRSGEGEFLINGTACRLKDIHELFMDTGVGKEGYSIISQGRIDEILSAKSESRRRIFEEAAGIVKFKTRKNEALLRLGKEQQNLSRIDDIIQELEGQIMPLEKESNIAKQYLKLKERLKAIQVATFCFRIDKIEKELEHLSEIQRLNQKEMEKFMNERVIQKNDIILFRKKSGELSEEIEEVNNEIINARTKTEKKEGETRLLQEQIYQEEQNIMRFQNEITEINKVKTELENEKKILNQKLTATELHLTANSEKTISLEKEFANLSRSLTKNEDEIDSFQTKIIEQIRHSTEMKGQISQKDVMKQQFEYRQNQLLQEIDYQKEQCYSLNIHLLAVKKQIEDSKNISSALNLELEQHKQEKDNHYQAIQVLEAEKEKLKTQLGEKRSRHTVLLEMENEYEGFLKSVKNILKQKEKHGDWDGIHGAVGELLHVNKTYETAIEIALGNAIQNIVTESEFVAQKAINYLKDNHLGRATFLPLTTVKGKKLEKENNKILSESGVLGVASDLVSFLPIYKNVIFSLLGKIVVVKNLDTAIILAKKYKHKYKMITLDGEFLHPSGSLTGGSVSRNSTSIFARSREMKTLQDDIYQLEKQMTNIMQTHEVSEKEFKRFSDLYIETQMELQKVTLRIQSLQEEHKKSEEKQKDVQDKLDTYEMEKENVMKQITTINNELLQNKEKLVEIEQKIEEMNQSLDRFQSNIESEKKIKDSLLNTMTELKIESSSFLQQKNNLLENIERLHKNAKELVQKEVKLKDNVNNYSCNKEKLQIQLSQLKEEMEFLKKEELEKQAILINFTKQRKQMLQKVDELEDISLECMETITKIKNELFRIEGKQEKLEEEKQRLNQEIWDEYELTYQSAKEYNTIECENKEFKNEIKELKNQLKNLGNVNVNAIEQYRTVKERFVFLSKQKQDIVEAEQKLREMIRELSILMENQFKQQFALISENFNQVFQEIFGGGKAYLQLEDETRILDSPIEIIAQPPGKKLQNMMLLSGGERALTAISILFSILKMKPSPFCILDEIEAALDDANVKRYAKFLKKYSDDTQFIVITHRKGTMEVADVLYGITMQEKGISKMLSVNFKDHSKKYLTN